jgi:hypothetical protein
MGTNSSSTTALSGLSVGVAFIITGAIIGFWLGKLFGSATGYISAAVMLVGLAGSLTEIQKQLSSSHASLKLDDLGVGIIFLVPSVWLLSVVYNDLSGVLRGLLSVGLLGLFMVGVAGTLDGMVSIFRSINASGRAFVSILKFIGLMATTLATVAAALKKAGVL